MTMDIEESALRSRLRFSSFLLPIQQAHPKYRDDISIFEKSPGQNWGIVHQDRKSLVRSVFDEVVVTLLNEKAVVPCLVKRIEWNVVVGIATENQPVLYQIEYLPNSDTTRLFLGCQISDFNYFQLR